MKLLHSFQLAKLLAYFSIATVQATARMGIFKRGIYCTTTWIRPTVKSRPNMKKKR